MTDSRDYETIPGTYVYDARRGREGYALNMFCMSLNIPENRRKFKEDEAVYLDQFKLTEEQRRTVLKRDWLGMLKVGGNIYYTIKIAFCDGLTFQDVVTGKVFSKATNRRASGWQSSRPTWPLWFTTTTPTHFHCKSFPRF
jgi:protocatechuate 4,5-dioxygenase alpha chain